MRLALALGYEHPAPPPGCPRTERGKMQIKALYSVFALLLVSACGSIGAQADEVDPKQAEFEQKVQDAVRAILRDPASAQFSEMKAYPDANAACGKVNAKNAFGGYAGEESFAYSFSQAATESSDPDLWMKLSNACQAAMNADTLKRYENTKRIVNETEMSEDERAKQIREIDRDVQHLKDTIGNN